MAIHPTHDYPDGEWFCTRCKTRKDHADTALRCVPVDDGDSAREPAEDYRAPEDWSGVVAW